MVFIRTEYLDLLEGHFPAKQNYEHIKTIKTTCASKGVVSGLARIVLSKEDANKVLSGDIMVAIGTDFDLMDAIQRSAGVITEEGGMLSHASVVCREFGIPCGIATLHATKVIPDGARVTLDTINGSIIIR